MVYDPALNAHMAVINPPLAAVRISVQALRFDDPVVLRELFLYSFDVDSNCIEFAFGEKLGSVDDGAVIVYETDPAVHVPPFRIQIAHQPATADISHYRFGIVWSLRY